MEILITQTSIKPVTVAGYDPPKGSTLQAHTAMLYLNEDIYTCVLLYIDPLSLSALHYYKLFTFAILDSGSLKTIVFLNSQSKEHSLSTLFKAHTRPSSLWLLDVSLCGAERSLKRYGSNHQATWILNRGPDRIIFSIWSVSKVLNIMTMALMEILTLRMQGKHSSSI
jgi:hypothetical protein